MAKVVKDLQARDKGKKVFTSEDFYDGLEGDEELENLPRKFIKFDGSGDPKAHLAMFFAECSKFKRDNRALFLCFPRSLEGTAAKWYSEHINPIELREFDKVVNLFIERFLFNTEALPTLSHFCNLRQNENEKARDFIRRWRETCNKMRDPISERHALSLILNNFSQPLRSLISTSPSKSFIELTERAEWLEMGLENGVYDGITLVKNNLDPKKKANFTSSANISRNDNKGSKGNHADREERQNSKLSQPNFPQKEKIKREGWSNDRVFTPLKQTLEEALEFMLTKGLVKLPKATTPPTIMGRFKNQFCKFHRAVGHDIDHCFVFKNIVQDCIDKSLLAEDEEEDELAILTKPFPDHSEN